MSSYVIDGGRQLNGELTVDTSKNSVLVLLAAALLVNGKVKINDCKPIEDVNNIINILKHLNCVVTWEKDSIIVDSTTLNQSVLPQESVKKLRGSLFLMGALLGRLKKATTYLPGGCSIGNRPIDIHLDCFRQLGVKVVEENEQIICDAENAESKRITLRYPSVGATENLIMFAVLLKGETVIYNAATEPEVVALEHFLNKCGAKIKGCGSRTLTIYGVESLHETEITPIPDRIVAASYVTAACITRGKLLLKNVNAEHLRSYTDVLGKSGVEFTFYGNSVFVNAEKGVYGLGVLETNPYPAFPTDMQSLALSLACVCNGKTVIKENVFENRFGNVAQLKQMGANVCLQNNVATVIGVDELRGCTVSAQDLRGGAGLVLAGLCARGITRVENVYHIERGYHDLCGALNGCGASITKV